MGVGRGCGSEQDVLLRKREVDFEAVALWKWIHGQSCLRCQPYRSCVRCEPSHVCEHTRVTTRQVLIIKEADNLSIFTHLPLRIILSILSSCLLISDMFLFPFLVLYPPLRKKESVNTSID